MTMGGFFKVIDKCLYSICVAEIAGRHFWTVDIILGCLKEPSH